MSAEKVINPYAIPGIVVTLDTVEQTACQVWQIDMKDLYKRTRKRKFVEPRQVVIHYRHTAMGESQNSMSKKIPFDHSTMNHAIRKVGELLVYNPAFRAKYNEFKSKLKR